jgi:hypothetical protein
MANILSNVFRAQITGALAGTPFTEPKYMAWGTGAGTSAVTDTTLFTEDSGGSPAYARQASTMSQVTTTATNDTLKAVGTITANAGKTITNMGLFDALTSGNLYLKSDFTGVVLNNGDSIQATFTHQLL